MVRDFWQSARSSWIKITVAEIAELLNTGVAEEPKDLEDTAEPNTSAPVSPKKKAKPKTPRKSAKKRVAVAVEVNTSVELQQIVVAGLESDGVVQDHACK